MYPNLLPNKPFSNPFTMIIIIVISALIHFPTSWCQDDPQYVACGQQFRCGNIQNIDYPFWGETRPAACGNPGFGLSCQSGVLRLTNQSLLYRVLQIDASARTLMVARDDLWSGNCPQYLYNTTFDFTRFNYDGRDNQNMTLFYGCTGIPFPVARQLLNEFDCSVNDTLTASFFVRTDTANVIAPGINPGMCSNNIIVPVNQTSARVLAGSTVSANDLRSALTGGFSLQWTANDTFCSGCIQSKGRCGYNSTTASFACYCADGPYPLYCNQNQNANAPGSGKGSQLPVVLPVVGAVLAGIGIGWLWFFCRQRRKRRAAESAHTQGKDLPTPLSSKPLSTISSTAFTASIPSYPSSKTEFGKSSYFGVQVFSYHELEEATDNFDNSKELGDGGFGTVYYGKLVDGREVAVKRLYENNFKRVEQFMNEVEILTRLHHENLVKLYGCTSKRSRELLLVYEYIANGTVADHLHGNRANSISGLLSWPVRLNIAIESANALAYLHESDIIHRDVKTNNILLDNNFRVKVADFGLSRLFPIDATHVSTAPQGTPGYVDPEYYQCYQLTDKSDVYSFGVVLIELISTLTAVDTNRHRHDINLANMAINKIQNHMLHELVDKSLGFETDSLVRRMTTLVAELAFRCLQQEKDMRPSMKEVLDILRGIQNEEFNAQKPEVLDIVVDDGALLKENHSPPSPDSEVTDRLNGSSVPNSSG